VSAAGRSGAAVADEPRPFGRYARRLEEIIDIAERIANGIPSRP
jgi:hypothetical protein